MDRGNSGLFSKVGYVYALYDIRDHLDIRYIGQSVRPEIRLKSHLADSMSNRKNYPVNYWIRKVIRSGSSIGMDIITCCSMEYITDIETFYISFYRDSGFFKIMNVSLCGGLHRSIPRDGGLSMRGKSIGTIEALRKSREKQRINRLNGIGMSDETKRKISVSKVGVPRPPVTDEFRHKISALMKGKPKSDLHRDKLSVSLKGSLPPNTGKSKYYYSDTNKGVFLHDGDPLIASGLVYKKHDYRNRSWKRGEMYGKKMVVEEF